MTKMRNAKIVAIKERQLRMKLQHLRKMSGGGVKPTDDMAEILRYLRDGDKCALNPRRTG